MTMNAHLVGGTGQVLEELLNAIGVRTTPSALDGLSQLASQPALQADVVVIDLRGRSLLPPAVALLRRRFPMVGVVIVASALDPGLMLEAMRAGVTELVAEPVTQAELKAAIERVVSKRPASKPGHVFAFLGGKGGVGTTTLAVNIASTLARGVPSNALLIDLHVAYGDAALFVGVEPRFSVADALENVHRLDETFLRSLAGRTKFGLDLLASSDRAMVGPVDVPAVRALIECASLNYSHVVLDVPRSDWTMLDALEAVSKIVIVANQELATVRSAGRLAAALRQRYGKGRVVVVVNRFDQLAEIGRSEIERVMGGPIAHMFASQYRLALGALNVGRPLVLDNHTKLAASFEGFARGLLSESTAGEPDSARPAGLLGRIGLKP